MVCRMVPCQDLDRQNLNRRNLDPQNMEKGSKIDEKGDGEGLGEKWVSLGGRGVEGRGEG